MRGSRTTFHRARVALACVALGALATGGARGAVTISTDPTQNMNCSGGICAPTAADAVLNTGDLETLLASGSVTVTTTGTGVEADDINVTAPFTWGTFSALALDAFRSITVRAAVSSTGLGGVSLVTNNGGSGGMLLFLAGGDIGFSDLTDVLTINGKRYELESTLKSLIYDIVRHPNRAFALANDIDAKHHGIYRSSPIPVNFGGILTGLGHAISKLEIANTADQNIGLFPTISASGEVSGLGLKNMFIDAIAYVGGVAGTSNGTIVNTWVSGTIRGSIIVGGVAGENVGTISNAWSSADIIGGNGANAGGLVGFTAPAAIIEASFATGTVNAKNGSVGGLVGLDDTASINNSYATGEVFGSGGYIGGLIGEEGGVTSFGSSYAIGHVGKGASYRGGFLGYNGGNVTASSCYWDTSTNGRNVHGVGNGDIAGITGLTAQQFQSGLPAGFDPTIWAEDPTINNGFPYLIANPPQ